MPIKNPKGYQYMGPGEAVFVPKEDAFLHALAMCVSGSEEDKAWFHNCFLTAFPDFISELELCYYSGQDWTIQD